MSRDDQEIVRSCGPRLFCDLTQSWSDVGGGVRMYLLHKRRHILDATPHRHLMIVPGKRDEVIEEERAITVTIASPHVPGSPHYRLMLRNGAVRQTLERFRPDLIECQDAYNLPWAAIGYRKRHPDTALVAAYMTDFPTVYVERPLSKVFGRTMAGALSRVCYSYCGALYRRFDAMFALSENGGATKLRSLGIPEVDVVPLGVELGEFGPTRRDPRLRGRLGLADDQPLLIYVGRLDSEKKPDVVVDAFRKLPRSLGTKLALIGEGPLKDEIDGLGDERIVIPGFMTSRGELAKWLASADIYVSAMADETFGVSIVEAQASGLPVVGVAAGAMIDRVTPAVGRLGPVNDANAMGRNIMEVLRSDRSAMASEARHEALKYSWDRSMELLFGEVYPAAFARRQQAAVSALAAAAVPA
ncbi:MAG TPA: glycosyltransferase [Sphingomicrobium sp.]|nr:glycosyltransferase [Sphingomicrobium sp.]